MKSLTTIALFLAFFLSFSATAQDTADVVSIWQKTRAAANSHDWDEYGRYLSDDILFDIPPNPPVVGKDAVKQMQVSGFNGSSDVHTEATQVLSAGNLVVVESLMSGTHDGTWSGIPATGKHYAVMLVDIFYSNGSKINKVTEYMDYLPIVIQIGVLPSSPPAALVPSFKLPDALPGNLSPVNASKELQSRWNNHNLADYAKMIHPEAKILVGFIGTPVNRDAYIALQESFFTSFPDIKGDITNLIDLGNGYTMTELVFSGTHKGDYFGIPGTGKPFMVRTGILSKFDKNGLLTNMSLYYDNMTILTQLGALEPPKTIEEINKEIRMRAYNELWNQGKLDVVDQIYADDFAGNMAGFTGKESVKISVQAYRAAFPDIHFAVEDIFAAGEFASIRKMTVEK